MDTRTRTDLPDAHASDAPAHVRLAAGRSDYDALADLFLGDVPEASPHPARPPEAARAPASLTTEGTAARAARPAPAQADPSAAPAVRRPVEVVVLGHLPVRAAIWVRQYAGMVAEKAAAPVGLVRLQQQTLSIELVGPGVDRLASTLDPSDHPAEAIETAAKLATRWIVRVDEPVEPALAEAPEVDAVTVLTGADEAAVVSSYRLIKSLTAAWEKRGDDAEPDLRVAIMGAVGARATEAREKLDRAVGAFLQRPLDVLADAARIGSVASLALHRAASDLTAEQLLSLLTGEDSTSAEESAPAGLRLTSHDVDWRPSDRPAEPADLDLGDDASKERNRVASEAAGPRAEPTAIAPAPAAMPLATVPARARSVQAEPKPAAAASAPTGDGPRNAVENLRSLAAVIGGLTTLEARCPHAPGVELAADAEGRLHLLATDVGADGDRMVDRLLSASAWARAHLALLLRAEPLLAQPSADPAVDSDAVLHLLTQTPSSTRALLEANLRVHLLVSVALGGRSGWVAHELN
jgi:hypothetical protein